MDIVVTVPKTFRYGDKVGISAWAAEGTVPATDPDHEPEEEEEYYCFTTYGVRPNIEPGERVYVVCNGRLRGYAPLVELRFHSSGENRGPGRVELIRQGGAVAVTIPERITGFRGWRYRWWERDIEVPFPDWRID